MVARPELISHSMINRKLYVLATLLSVARNSQSSPRLTDRSCIGLEILYDGIAL